MGWVTTHRFQVGMHQRSTVQLRTVPSNLDAHRGMWAFDPDLYPNVDIGDRVEFENNGKVYATGHVTGFISYAELLRRLGAKPCSAVNRVVILWE
jgi:plastocyanin